MNPIEICINLFISTFFRWWPQDTPSLGVLESAKIVAHRGVLDSPGSRENSLHAFELALQNQIYAIELDIRYTKDLVPVVIHDENCERLFDRADLNISQTTYAELSSQVDILSLQQVVEKFGQKLHLMIEIKEDLRQSPEKLLVLSNLLKGLTPAQDYHLLTLNPEFLQNLGPFDPKTIMDVIWLDGGKIFDLNEKMGHGGVAGHFLFFKTKRISSLHSRGKSVGVGFIDSQNSLYRELNRGVDFIFTNHPLKLKKILKHARQKGLDASSGSI